jgi:hypothetical protein
VYAYFVDDPNFDNSRAFVQKLRDLIIELQADIAAGRKQIERHRCRTCACVIKKAQKWSFWIGSCGFCTYYYDV